MIVITRPGRARSVNCVWRLFAALCLAEPWLVVTAPVAISAEPPNVLLICVDDLRPELGCYGKSYVSSPNIDRLAASGRAFRRHYVQAPTCGASRYALLTGRYGPADNKALFRRAERLTASPQSVPPSMPAWFREHGYRTVSVGKVSHHPGGLGGADWDDPAKPEMPESWDKHLQPCGLWRHPRGIMHGLAHGEIRVVRGEMDAYQAADGPDSIYPDGLTTAEALRQLQRLSDDKSPFFLAVGIIRPHLPFGAPAQYLRRYSDVDLPLIPHPKKPVGRTTWHRSSEFRAYNLGGRDPNTDADFADLLRSHYASCVSYADAQVGLLLDDLDRKEIAASTIVVLWGDHGWHLGEHAVWGKHTLFEESLRSPLIIRSPGIPEPGAHSDAVTETAALFPTLCELAGLPTPGFCHGRSAMAAIGSPAALGHDAVSYTPKAVTLRTETHRLVLHEDGYAELYDHQSPAAETLNTAKDNPELVAELTAQLFGRVGVGSLAEFFRVSQSTSRR